MIHKAVDRWNWINQPNYCSTLCREEQRGQKGRKLHLNDQIKCYHLVGFVCLETWSGPDNTSTLSSPTHVALLLSYTIGVFMGAYNQIQTARNYLCGCICNACRHRLGTFNICTQYSWAAFCRTSVKLYNSVFNVLYYIKSTKDQTMCTGAEGPFNIL